VGTLAGEAWVQRGRSLPRLVVMRVSKGEVPWHKPNNRADENPR